MYTPWVWATAPNTHLRGFSAAEVSRAHIPT